MTSERLGRLRAWVEQSAGTDLPFVYSDGILRLLDEREALLEALRGIEWAGIPADIGPACPACDRTDQEGHKPDCRLAAAIAKAEAP